MKLMRLLRAHCLSVLAMLVLLLGTAAPALARMTCVSGGHTQLSIGQPEDCCPPADSRRSTVDATCCELLQAQPQRSAFVPVAASMVPMPMVMVLPAPLCMPLALVSEVPVAIHRLRPPPLEQARRLAATGFFRI